MSVAITPNVERVGGEFLVNTQTQSLQLDSSITGLAGGGFVVSWTDRSGTLGDASGKSIKAQLFDGAGATVGSEFLVNTITDSDQEASAISSLANGGFIVSWLGSDSMFGAIKAQRFDAAGGKVDGEFLVPTNVGVPLSRTAVTGLDGGNFVVSWTSRGAAPLDTDGSAVKAKVFDAAGNTVASEFLVNTATLNSQDKSTLAGLANGGFVAAWIDASDSSDFTIDYNIKAQLFNATGGKVGGEFLVNTQNANWQDNPNITALAGGGFVVTWDDASGTQGDASGTSVKAQVFNASGAKVGSEFLVNTQTATDQKMPGITGLAGGGFVVAWQDASGTLGDASPLGIKAQLYSATGLRVGGEFLVNSQTANTQESPSISALDNGGFVVTWTDWGGTLGDASPSSIKAQIFKLLFGDGVDQVNFNALTVDQSAAIDATTHDTSLLYNGWSGDDVVQLPDAAHLQLTASFHWDPSHEFDAGAGNDAVTGGTADDHIGGGAGDDSLHGATGDDILTGGSGGDQIDGDEGSDTASYIGSLAPVVIDLAAGTASGGDADGDTLTEIESLTGSNEDDTLNGDANANILRGRPGDDVLDGREGNDWLIGGSGDDALGGGSGNDGLRGGLGRDILTSGSGYDLFVFGDVMDSQAGAPGGPSRADVLMDFIQGIDRISLAEIDSNTAQAGDQAFIFIGHANYSGQAGELRTFLTADRSQTVVQGDVDGDAKSDFSIMIMGKLNLHGSDFLL